MAQYYSIKNFATYQHKGVSSGIWVKLYASSVDDPELIELSEQSRLTWHLLLAIGGQQDNKIYSDIRWLREKLHFPNLRRATIDELIKSGFLIPYSSSIALHDDTADPAPIHTIPVPDPAPMPQLVPDPSPAPVATAESDAAPAPKKKRKSTPKMSQEEVEADPGWQRFWDAYPRRESKVRAKETWAKLTRDGVIAPENLDAVISAAERLAQSRAWTKDNIQYCKLPSSWLNDRRWEDEQFSGGTDQYPRHVII